MSEQTNETKVMTKEQVDDFCFGDSEEEQKFIDSHEALRAERDDLRTKLARARNAIACMRIGQVCWEDGELVLTFNGKAIGATVRNAEPERWAEALRAELMNVLDSPPPSEPKPIDEPKVGSFQEVRDAIASVPGGNAWDAVADPDAVIAEMREQPKQSAEPTDTEMLDWLDKKGVASVGGPLVWQLIASPEFHDIRETLAAAMKGGR